MSRIGFLRRQAETCLRLAETCSDKTTAEYLRLMGAEFFKRAVEAEMTGFMPPVRRMQVQSGEPNKSACRFSAGNAAGNSGPRAGGSRAASTAPRKGPR